MRRTPADLRARRNAWWGILVLLGGFWSLVAYLPFHARLQRQRQGVEYRQTWRRPAERVEPLVYRVDAETHRTNPAPAPTDEPELEVPADARP